MRNFEDVDALSVFQYKEKIKGQPPAFLQCGGFVYPLIPGKSPILKTSDKVYMFPELKNDGMIERDREREREERRERERGIFFGIKIHVGWALRISMCIQVHAIP